MQSGRSDRRSFLRTSAAAGAALGGIGAASRPLAALMQVGPEQRIRDLGLQLPEPQGDFATLAAAVQSGNTLYVSGHGPRGPEGNVTGKLGGDLTVEITPRSEKDVLATSFKAMVARLRDTNGKIQDGTDVLASSISQIAAATAELAASVAETSAAVIETASAVEEVKEIAQAAGKKAREVSDEANQTANVSRAGEQAVAAILPAQGGSIVLYSNHTSTDQVAGFGGGAKRSIGSKLMGSELEKIFAKVQTTAR